MLIKPYVSIKSSIAVKDRFKVGRKFLNVIVDIGVVYLSWVMLIKLYDNLKSETGSGLDKSFLMSLSALASESEAVIISTLIFTSDQKNVAAVF